MIEPPPVGGGTAAGRGLSQILRVIEKDLRRYGLGCHGAELFGWREAFCPFLDHPSSRQTPLRFL